MSGNTILFLKVTFISCLGFVLSYEANAQSNQVPDDVEYQALKDLYDSTNGAGWTNKTNWLQGTTSADFATWFGIEVANGDIKAIKLGNNNLDGIIPSSIGDFRKMIYLHLYSNKLTGSIPVVIGTLPLAHLKLNNNQLSGSIPASIFQRSIQQVMLSQNNLSGSLPDFGNVTIQYLILNHNQLSGALPESFGNIKGLYRLYLNDNQLTGPLPQSFGNHPALENIRLYNNKITGEIPPSIGNMTALKYISLNNNQLTGTLPASIGKLKLLAHLSISYNKLNKSLPDSMVYMSALNHLDLRFNSIPGNIPDSIGNLKKLLSLYLNGNNLEGEVPESIGNMPNLYTLHLGDNNLGGVLPEGMSRLTKLKNIYLYNNLLEGPIPEALATFTVINEINIRDNSFTTFPDFSGNINKSMFSIMVSNNKLSFEDLEPNMQGINQPIFKQFSYDTQAAPPADTLAFNTGQLVMLEAGDNAPHNRYQWQKLINGTWSNITGASENTYTISSIDASHAGAYRCRMTNDWVTNLTIYSKISVIQATSEYWSVADGNWTTDKIWSTTKGGAPVTGYPQGGSKVFIVGNQVTLNSSLSCGTLEVIVENNEASLIVDGAEITVQGEVRLTKTTEGYPGNIKVVNGGRLIPVE